MDKFITSVTVLFPDNQGDINRLDSRIHELESAIQTVIAKTDMESAPWWIGMLEITLKGNDHETIGSVFD